jgi:hypothetical protein
VQRLDLFRGSFRGIHTHLLVGCSASSDCCVQKICVILLRTEKYDLAIISASLSEWEKSRILSAAGKIPTYVLGGLTFAPELLDEIERRLPPVNQSASSEDLS